MRSRFTYFLLLFTFLHLLTCSQNVKEEGNNKGKYHTEALTNAINALEMEEIMQNGTLSFCLYSVRTSERILAHNEKKSLNVASCIKAVTTATALDLLGENYRFQTALEYDGELKGGILRGNLYIKGYGDPSLASKLVNVPDLPQTLQVWAEEIKKAGIRQINGNIIADEALFGADVLPATWIWGDIGNYYGAFAGAINVQDNTYELFFQPGKLGEKAKIIKTEPSQPGLQFINLVKTAEAGSGDRASISGAPFTQLRVVNGTIPAGGIFSIKGAIPDPGLYLAEKLKVQLHKNAIKTSGTATSTRLIGLKGQEIALKRTRMYTHLSPALKDLIDATNLYSINHFAEAIFKACGLKLKKDAGNEAATLTLKEYWAAKKIDSKGMYLWDGSGLAFANAISAETLTRMLLEISKEKYFNDFYNSLPVSGVSGTMKTIGLGSKAHNNLRAKTGGMTRVAAFTGYFRTQQNELMAFTLIANNHTCDYKEIRHSLDKIIRLMAEI